MRKMTLLLALASFGTLAQAAEPARDARPLMAAWSADAPRAELVQVAQKKKRPAAQNRNAKRASRSASAAR